MSSPAASERAADVKEKTGSKAAAAAIGPVPDTDLSKHSRVIADVDGKRCHECPVCGATCTHWKKMVHTQTSKLKISGVWRIAVKGGASITSPFANTVNIWWCTHDGISKMGHIAVMHLSGSEAKLVDMVLQAVERGARESDPKLKTATVEITSLSCASTVMFSSDNFVVKRS